MMLTLQEVVDSDSHIDVTDELECYEHGKTWDCDCGADMWGYHETQYKKCPECGDVSVDRKYEEREAPDTTDEQMTLGAF
jgi:predicted RNA-binding Zn-ribbon protein involved in translation (DUF1610 family)